MYLVHEQQLEQVAHEEDDGQPHGERGQQARRHLPHRRRAATGAHNKASRIRLLALVEILRLVERAILMKIKDEQPPYNFEPVCMEIGIDV